MSGDPLTVAAVRIVRDRYAIEPEFPDEQIAKMMVTHHVRANLALRQLGTAVLGTPPGGLMLAAGARLDAWLARQMCRRGRHRWNLAFRRVGEDQPCRRGCGAVAKATPDGWVITDSAGREVESRPESAPAARKD